MSASFSRRLRVVDSHSAGEPTRVIVSGAEQPTGRSMSEKRASFASDLDWIRTASVCEPRGHDAMVGALLCEPSETDCVAGVIFFNNVGVLHGCLHGTMGLAVTLVHLGRIGPGEHGIDTPTGIVTVLVGEDRSTVTVGNVASRRAKKDVSVSVPGYGEIRGDVAWGGNWFFLTDAPTGLPVEVAEVEALTEFAWRVRLALAGAGVRGDDGDEVDHVEVFGPPADPAAADGKNFVLCPGKAYDRSPCGTGTSAKLACLAADGRLAPGQTWRQAGILDTVFAGSIESCSAGSDTVLPTVTGAAHVTAEAELVLDPADPFALGIPAPAGPTLSAPSPDPVGP